MFSVKAILGISKGDVIHFVELTELLLRRTMRWEAERVES